MIGAIVAVDVEFEAGLVAALTGLADVEVLARPADDVDLLAAAQAGQGSVAVLSRHFPGADAEVVRRLLGSGAKVLGFGADAEVFARWGVRHTVSPWAEPEALAAALRDCAADLEAPPKPAAPPAGGSGARRAPLIVVWGTGSAPGRSTVAAGLAHALAQSVECVLVDADTVAAAQAPMLGILDDAPHLAALCRAAAAGPLDAEQVGAHIVPLSQRLGVVTGLSRPERWPEIRPGVLAEVLGALAERAQCLVADVSDRIDPDDEFADPHYDRHGATRAVLDAADHVVIVAGAEPLGLQRLIALLAGERGQDLRERCTIVLNRVRAQAVGADPERRIAETLERFAGVVGATMLPDARPDVDAALLAARTVTEHAPHSALSRALRGLAAQLPVPGVAQPRRAAGGRRGRRGKMKP
ncbi:DNA-binding response regulator [Brevibacterium sp. 5221]|uniref:DNA-binding response regulator n=1 Tax=Brevibacterium rongguiense TaxID=2695267 RepID=A0A6N9H7T8_9MICO|nr:DNA-binding response regulator [Brevibacterium rongguiense]MYM19632.1 DNA-binding response regulator [Brevibacterium rongguiense]